MSFLHVNKAAPELVCPSGPTPSGDLPLSGIDRCPLFRHVVEMILVFDKGSEPAQVIREALAKALVPYYPVAGRIATVSDGELGVACTCEGVWFVEASSDCQLEDVDYLSRVPSDFSKELLLPSPPQEIHEFALPFMMQVTQFKCGGFVVGVKFNHAFFDGVGIGQFIIAIGEMARGLDEPTVKPVWSRDVFCDAAAPVIPVADMFQRPVESEDHSTKLICCSIDIPLDRINREKDRFAESKGKKCSTFDVVAAKLWQSRTRAINLKRDAGVHLGFVANVRHLHEELPPEGGYYGNCCQPALLDAASEQIANASLLDVVTMIKDVKESFWTKYSRILTGLDRPPLPQVPTYRNLFLIDNRRLGYYKADFGWGGPRLVVMLNEHRASSGECRILNSPLSAPSIRVMANCVVEEHHEAFLNEMNSWP